ncbi:MAG TPA: hypothetical protein PLM07_06145 [Candidatus Rifleibacterium sp.]|nr:hypothetical protein [Candidatus Rifleibacterium sp.]HPT45461.1 hypothetical protein [Candidatus Rifleibacterium sp.]
MTSIKKQNGSALLMVMVLAACLGMLALSYFRVATESRHSSKWHEIKNTAIEASRSLQEEAYATLIKDLKNPKSQIFWFLLGAVSGARNELRLPFARQNLVKTLPPGYDCDFSCELKVISFKNTAPEGKSYHGKHEGHGILAIRARVDIFRTTDQQRKSISHHELEIHHDYLVASMLSPDQHGSTLRKALLIRKERGCNGQNPVISENVQLQILQNETHDHLEKPENLQVFNHFSLWARRDLTSDDLLRQRIIDTTTRTLNLNGIYHCRGQIVFDGQWQIRGQGVLIADNFVINNSIKKSESNALAVFFARRGNIRINTDKEVQAALIAINNNGTGSIEALQSLNLNGMILADSLNLQHWKPGKHIVVYDQTLSDPDKAYQISVSRWISYLGNGENS